MVVFILKLFLINHEMASFSVFIGYRMILAKATNKGRLAQRDLWHITPFTLTDS